MAAAEFPGQGVSDLIQASSLLKPALGVAASKLFAIGLLASGQQATLTCTIAGQVVLEGFLGPGAAIKPWARRLATRSAAIVPALIVAVTLGAKGTAYLLNLSQASFLAAFFFSHSFTELKCLLQVIQSLALPFCSFPLIHFASSKALLGELVAPRWFLALGWVAWLVVTGLNSFLVYQFAAAPSATS